MKGIRKRKWKQWGRQLLSFVLVVALMLGLIPSSAYATGVTPTKAEQTYASEGCSITYKETSSWGNYVNADIVLKNDTDSDKSLWKIEMVYDGCIDNIWNADIISFEDGHYTIAAKTYNSTIAAGQSVSFGFMAYGEDGKPAFPSEISFVDDSENTGGDSTEEDGDKDGSEEEDDSPTAGQEYTIPDKWKGLNYALFTSGEDDLSFYTNTTKINGSVHTNQDFYYQGTSLNIDGVLEATKGITLKTASGEDNLYVASKQEQADVLEMPGITKEVYSYVKENGTIYESNKDFNSDSVVIDTPIGIEGSATFNATTFLGQGIVYAKDSVTYNVGDLSTPEDSRVFVASENGNITLNGSNITLNAVLYAPNGCVYINANNVNINGRIIAKQICINGTTININAEPYDYDMLVFLFKPEIDLIIEGNQKVNRKVTLSVKEILNTEYIVKEDTVWNITKDGTTADEQYLIDSDNSNAFHKEILFKEAGTYTVAVTVTTGKVDYTVTKEVVIVEDMSPVAGFTLDSDYYSRNEEGIATIELKDCSTSPDGDVIGQRVWTIYYDENNDGTFDESEGSVLDEGNETKITFETEEVGNYKVVLRVVEAFEDTIPKLLSENAYLLDDTTEYTDKESVFEVGNEAPLANLDIEKSKSVDIVFTVGDTDKDSLEIYNAKAESLKKILAEKEIDAKVDTVSTSTFTAQDTFAWKEYSHYNCDGFAEHIMYEDNSIKMVGYYSSPKKDFLYIANDNPGQKTFEFDLQRDRSDWHSMEGGGFLFNTTVDEENNTIRGFCILVSQSGLKLVQIDCNNLKAFRDGSYNWVQHAGKLLKTFPIKNLYDSHHFKIVVDNKTISVWDGDTLVIDNIILPDNDYGYGFGPITSHASHGCGQRSYFTFQNIRMESMTGSSLSDIVDGYEWRHGASHYVFNLSNTEVPELASEEETADLAAALIKNDAAFIGIGNETNESQYLSLLNAIETGGMYLPMDGISEHMDEANAYIVDSVLAKNYTIGQYITTDDIVTYKGYYQDAENDEIYEQQWEYEYDPSVFTSAQGSAEHIVRNESEPITVFENTGAYSIRLNIRDNPAGENDALDEYRKWSRTEEYEKLLIVQSRPVAEVSVEVSENASDKTTCIANVTYSAEDIDHADDSTKGIREEYFWYKNVKDGSWTEGKLPNKLTVGETYLVKYQVKDAEGTWSFPDVAVVKTSDLLVYEEIADELPPEVYIDVAKEEIKVGEELRIDGYALDDYGIDSFVMYMDGEQVLDSFGRILYTGKEEGTVTIKAVATDTGGNTSEKELTIKVTDDRDKIAPTAEITAPVPGAEIGFDVQIRGSAKDETEFSKYTLSYKEEQESEYHVFKESTTSVSNDILGSLDITEFTDGTYEILLTVEDAAGNVAYYGIVLYIQTGVTKGYTIKGELSETALSEDYSQIVITGTASVEGHMKQYTLSYQLDGEGELVVIAEGTEEVDNATLGVITTQGLKSGLYNLLLTVEDTDGNTGTACGAFEYTEGEIEIQADLVAPEAEITGLKLIEDCSTISMKASVRDDKELKGYTLSYAKEGSEEYSELATGTEQIEDTPIAMLPTEVLEDGTYNVKLQAWDACGNSVTYTMSFTYQKGSTSIETSNGNETETPVPSESVKKDFAVALSHSAANIGTEVQVQVTLPDNIKQETLKVTMGDKELATGTRKTSFTSGSAGRVEIAATGTTDEGEECKVSAYCTFYNMTDKNPPTVAITSPTIDQVLTKPVDIVGSAYDAEELDFWKLEYRMKGDTEYQLLAEGTESKKDEVLGHFDTTMLMNGQYEVKLTVQDKGGNIRRLENDYVVEGELKVGAIHIGFTDITANMGGTTVSVNRVYDSRNKAQGDFGYGWNLGMQGMTLTESGNIAEGYQLVQSGSIFSTGYQMTETISHDVIVSYGDGTSDHFELTFTPERRALVPISEVEIGYRCVTNQKVKLEIVGDTTAYVSGTELVFYEESMYDTLNYKLTTEEGNEIYLNSKKGVYKIVDTSGNVITVNENGYHSENGKSITFTRDAKGRVTTAKDPIGNVTTYAYDEAGDLVSVTDSANRTVTFTYDKKHNLMSITDPMGIAVARNEYDDEGRLVATIDADGNRVEYDYDIEGRTQAVKDKRGNTTVYTYDDNGNILRTVDAYGNKTDNTYDKYNNLLTTTDAKGNTTSYAYDGSGNVTQVTAPDGTKVESTYTQENYVSGIQMMDKTVMAMEYDDKGRLTSVEDANGNVTEYDYTSDGKLTGLTDEIGTYQKVTYDDKGNVATTTNGAGESASYTYDEDGRCTSVTISREENGETLTFTSYYSYNAAGDITQSIDNAGNITQYEYDANGNQTASTDAKGRRIVYTYDDLGNMTKVTYPDGTFETFTYDANGNNITATDRNGLTVTMSYDKLDRMTEKKYADGTKESYAYDEVGNVIEQVSTSGAKTRYGYDNRNCNISITDTYQNVTTFEYDESARLTKRIDALGNTISYEYDDNGNIIKTTYADGNSVTSEYDARNRVTRQEDQYGNETKYEYDGADRLTKVTDAYDNSYSYGYDANGNLVIVTDANEHVTRYSYDDVGRVATVTNALGKTMSYSYDETGNVTEFKDYAGTVTTYSYDDMDRLVEKKVGSEKTIYNYDDKGQLIKVRDKSGEISYGYDKYGRLTSRTNAMGVVISYNYDKAGRLETFDNGFGTTTYEYDLLDRVTRVIDRNGKATVYEYDELGNRSAVRYPNGNVVTYTYDACQRLKEEWIVNANGVTLAKYTYGLGKAGERNSITELVNGTETEITYKYDKLNRLSKETIARDDNSITNEFEYDAVSNRISKETAIKGDISELTDVGSEEIKVTEGKTTYTYNALNQLVTETSEEGTITYTFDRNGNLIKQTGDKVVDYSYDKENHLLRATIQKGNSVTIESYTYDYEGNRTSKTVNETNITYYVNDTSTSLTMVVAETDKQGKEIASYTRGDELLSIERNGEVWYYLYDGHGSVRTLTNEAGRVTDRYAYDAYGNLLEKEGDSKNEFLYTGEQYNANTGLYYLRARYMNPSTGTFICMDSYQGSVYDPVTLHKYLYANANPVMYTDPSGYFSLAECSISTSIQSTLNSIHQINSLRKIINWVDAMCTLYDTAMEIKKVMLEGGSILDVIGAMLKGVTIGFMVNKMCDTSLGIVLKPMMAIFGLGDQVDQIQEALKEGDPVKIAVKFVQLVCMLFGLTSQCFTGDTLVSTETGLCPIAEIQIGDYVWSEDTELGEKELKQVTGVSVTMTNIIVYVTMETGITINTTENHPFYVEGKGWCAAAELETGDVCRTEDGQVEIVASVVIAQQEEPVKVYNLTIEDKHTYYVSIDKVLVHNGCRQDVQRKEWKEYTGKEATGEVHHGLPEQFSDWFKSKGIDINSGEYYYDLPTGLHRLKDGNGIHTNNNVYGKNWNAVWKEFKNNNPNANKTEILEFLSIIEKAFGISEYKAIPKE